MENNDYQLRQLLNLVLPSEFLSQVKTVYQINSTYESGTAQFEMNKT